MSTAENPAAAAEDTARTGTIIREFVATDIEVTGRTVDVRVVPFGEVARVADPPDYRQYDEEWMPGVFDGELNAAFRIHAKVGHTPYVVNTVGRGIADSLRAERDGYHVSLLLFKTEAGEATLNLLRDGALPSVSLEALPKKGGNDISSRPGVVRRVKAALRAVAFVPEGAFTGAKVLAVRETPETIDEELFPVDIDPERVERLRAQGIALPDRYTKAHPAETDTPAQAGTSDDGTRQTQATTSSEE